MTMQDNQHFFRKFLTQVRPHQQVLLKHPVYEQLTALSALRIFMQMHVFAVWDNMTLLKSLQQRLTCVTTPWVPPSDPIAARLINEIILDEETESFGDGEYLSHMQFYVMAMADLGAQTQPIEQLMDLLQSGTSLETALSHMEIAPSATNFVLTTWQICQGSTAGIAAAFLSGREEISPPMFAHLLKQLDRMERSPISSENAWRSDRFRNYCQHHVGLDEAQHIPIAKKLLCQICRQDPEAWKRATTAAIATLAARKQLWDGILAAISPSESVREVA
ncbi:MAG: DUF3050 domain-containing protein [Synechococcales cyanobacterium CRU_2_2]|nr:DUF3050 domain-containing protein [Synechococcales cyanobacterium CRU_2_2]